MPHINELIDFTNASFIVFDGKVLLIKHKKLGKWLPIGGHIELHEDPDEALWREIEEECGLVETDLTPLCEKLDLKSEGTKFLLTPNRLDIHDVKNGHRHVGMIYYFISSHDRVKLEEGAHDEIRWVSESELEDAELNLSHAIKYYCIEAIKLAKARINN